MVGILFWHKGRRISPSRGRDTATKCDGAAGCQSAHSSRDRVKFKRDAVTSAAPSDLDGREMPGTLVARSSKTHGLVQKEAYPVMFLKSSQMTSFDPKGHSGGGFFAQ